MSVPLAHLIGCLLALAPGRIEERGAKHIREEFERVGRRAPRTDPALTAAARRLAQEALETSAEEAADVLALSAAVSDAGGFDPMPRAVAIRSNSAAAALESLLRRTDLNTQPASHLGIGAASRGRHAAVVTLLADRRASLRPFPRTLPAGGPPHRLCGELAEPLRRAEVFITRPSGRVDRVTPEREGEESFCAWLSFSESGRHAVEVIGRGPKGPEVAALFNLDAGAQGGLPLRARFHEPTTPGAARRAVLERVNALRAAQGLPALEADRALDAVAQAYSERMADQGFFAHVSPDGEDLSGRLTRAGYDYQAAGENLGLATGPLAAQFVIELSPGHRLNLLNASFTRLGIGLAPSRAGGGDQLLLTEILATPAPTPAAAPRPRRLETLEDAYRALAAQRAARGLPPLRRNELLEQLASSHARRALELDQPRVQLAGSSVYPQVFATLPQVRLATVDIFVIAPEDTLPDSKSLADPRNDQVGIGAARGASPTYGEGKLWMVVIYTSSR